MALSQTNGVLQPIGPFKLVTVNTAPDRAARLIGRMIEILSDRYTILHVANIEGTSRFLKDCSIWQFTDPCSM